MILRKYEGFAKTYYKIQSSIADFEGQHGRRPSFMIIGDELLKEFFDAIKNYDIMLSEEELIKWACREYVIFGIPVEVDIYHKNNFELESDNYNLI